ncbi:hypothetical protein ACH4OY_25710 [Micromonospora rubida]|uniref:DUF732 domain-containing protein n=1 Tax=Micromonospora rubida TaxID=2697657 RepID=A0ABW7SQR9_9ACTN
MTYPQHPADAHNTTPAVPPQQPWTGAADGQPYPPQPAGFPAPPAKPSRKPIIVAAAAIVGVLALGTIGYVVWDGYIKEDSGVAVCKAIRDGKQMDGSAKDSDNGDDKLTEKEYRAARALFEDSRHDDIREHGTALIDIVWQMSKLPKGQEMSALAFIGPMGTHVSGLQTACADQGVIVDLNKD